MPPLKRLSVQLSPSVVVALKDNNKITEIKFVYVLEFETTNTIFYFPKKRIFAS